MSEVGGVGRRTGLSWAAATWTVPFVPGLVLVLVTASRTQAQSRLLTLAVLGLLVIVGAFTLLLARGSAQRGVGAGLVAGAVAGALLLAGLST